MKIKRFMNYFVTHFNSNVPISTMLSMTEMWKYSIALLGDGFWGEGFDRNACKNLIKRSVRPPVSWRTILSFAEGNNRYVFVADSMDLDRDPKVSDQRIPPCPPAGIRFSPASVSKSGGFVFAGEGYFQCKRELGKTTACSLDFTDFSLISICF